MKNKEALKRMQELGCRDEKSWLRVLHLSADNVNLMEHVVTIIRAVQDVIKQYHLIRHGWATFYPLRRLTLIPSTTRMSLPGRLGWKLRCLIPCHCESKAAWSWSRVAVYWGKPYECNCPNIIRSSYVPQPSRHFCDLWVLFLQRACLDERNDDDVQCSNQNPPYPLVPFSELKRLSTGLRNRTKVIR